MYLLYLLHAVIQVILPVILFTSCRRYIVIYYYIGIRVYVKFTKINKIRVYRTKRELTAAIII